MTGEGECEGEGEDGRRSGASGAVGGGGRLTQDVTLIKTISRNYCRDPPKLVSSQLSDSGCRRTGDGSPSTVKRSSAGRHRGGGAADTPVILIFRRPLLAWRHTAGQQLDRGRKKKAAPRLLVTGVGVGEKVKEIKRTRRQSLLE